MTCHRTVTIVCLVFDSRKHAHPENSYHNPAVATILTKSDNNHCLQITTQSLRQEMKISREKID